ncbi:MAG: hypothetical protein Q4P78_00645 [Rothia sp. (in: high G+C Gram-positive bacteria)]|uniref:hypothetical protein n=1 Tax=Rothia sp. (in: high G+C Gram-positive bacteria) TaxID=1885016 RepID=UPI0026DEEAA6|nr:hypothetical protein [Rothia sp. (in: high G+C Gram-positive bacteria)]MDO5749698.1 hypothetical protein [Rothia sp. (in: high G+C Gram-positive bacteria)]
MVNISYNRRSALRLAALGGAVAVVGVTMPIAEAGETLPNGCRVGKFVEKLDEVTYMYELISPDNKVVGYTLDRKSRQLLKAVVQEVNAKGGIVPPPVQGTSTQADPWACALAIGEFVALAAFPWARGAKVAWRLLSIVRRYGVDKTARILTGSYHLAEASMRTQIRQLIGDLTGIGAIAHACFS